jgi:hypothetical protein
MTVIAMSSPSHLTVLAAALYDKGCTYVVEIGHRLSPVDGRHHYSSRWGPNMTVSIPASDTKCIYQDGLIRLDMVSSHRFSSLV